MSGHGGCKKISVVSPLGTNSVSFSRIFSYIYQVLRKVQGDCTTGTTLRLFSSLRTPTRHDVDFTFAQRVHWNAFLLRYHKSCANRFMCQLGVEAYVVRIWSVLLLEESFRGLWQSLNTKHKEDCIIQYLYVNVTYGGKRYYHPTVDEVPFWKAAV
jgi:hypothetical protein